MESGLHLVTRNEPHLPAAAGPAPSPIDPEATRAGNTALLVEPSQAMAAMLQAAILQSGIPTRQCVVAKDIGEAVDILNTRDDIGLVAADCDFPSPTGEPPAVELLRNQRLRGVPLVALSSLVNPDEIESLLGMGAAAFIRKPFDTGLLIEQLAVLAGFPGNRGEHKR